MILGDNIIEGSIAEAVRHFERQERGARILLKEVPDAERFGVAELAGDRIVGIEEKPAQPKSRYAVIGIYLYDGTVFDKVKELVPSGRGELEITDVNNAYIREGAMTFSFLEWSIQEGERHAPFADVGIVDVRDLELAAGARAPECGSSRRPSRRTCRCRSRRSSTSAAWASLQSRRCDRP